MDLIEETKQRLIARKADWMKISKSSGISFSWIVKFADDQIRNPGYLTLQKLRAELAAKRRKATN